MVLLVSDGQRRRWCATDSFWLAADEGGADSEEYQVLVSPRLVTFGSFASQSTGSATLSVSTVDGEMTVRSGEQMLSVAIDARASQYPDVVSRLISAATQDGASVDLDAEQLSALLHLASHRPVPDTEDPLFWVAANSGELVVSIDWPGLSVAEYTLRGAGAGSAAMAVPPSQMRSTVDGMEGPVSLRIPQSNIDPMKIDSGTRSVLIMPMRSGVEAVRTPVESLLADLFGPDVLSRDGDGDYRLTVRDTPVFARLYNDHAPTLQVFAVVLADVPRSPDLLGELNDFNSRLAYARSFWVDEQVLVESDLVAATLDPEELIAAVTSVRNIANELGPMVAAIFGGRLLARDRSATWQTYLDTVITAELAPTQIMPLTGANAIPSADWPFSAPVHVLTAHNPYGRARSPEQNAEALADLGRILTLYGIAFARAEGRDGSAPAEIAYTETGVLAWGMTRDDAVSLGRRYDQEAIFELTADEVLVISCDEDRIASRSRVTHDLAEESSS